MCTRKVVSLAVRICNVAGVPVNYVLKKMKSSASMMKMGNSVPGPIACARVLENAKGKQHLQPP